MTKKDDQLAFSALDSFDMKQSKKCINQSDDKSPGNGENSRDDVPNKVEDAKEEFEYH